MRFFRYCLNCGKKYYPNGKFSKLCEECYQKVRNANFIKLMNFRNININKIRI
jgi:uncharacterized OB-fold protein